MIVVTKQIISGEIVLSLTSGPNNLTHI